MKEEDADLDEIQPSETKISEEYDLPISDYTDFNLISGEAPILLESGNDENAIVTIFGGSESSGEVVGFGAEQVILVRDERAKTEIYEYIGRQALVLTILESQAMRVVSSPQEWRERSKKGASNSKLTSKSTHHMPAGYRPVHVNWKDLDKCNVCHMDEEYANKLFLQCDKCRMMVHARCYGELKPVDGVLWLRNLCRPGAPEVSPPCCLCPVTETCLSDIKKMEPVDGMNRIRPLEAFIIYGVPYGACIQCVHMADKKNEARSSSGISESVVSDFGSRRTPCRYCKSGTSITH
nr:histone-lysine N-methyltransferase ATX2-like isoform X1 [Tanacetum cinerariifolium]